MLTPEDLRGIADELRCNAEALRDGHTLRSEWHDDDAKREHDKLIRWADALVAVHAGPIKSHEAIDWSRSAAEISADYLAIVRERDALASDVKECIDVIDKLTDLLTRTVNEVRGTPPDGEVWGWGSLPECVRELRTDAERYRWLRRKFCIISDGEGNAEFCPINLPRPVYIAPNTAIELDTALDRERLGLDGTRPPTPVGWSDTDWIKHLQEQDGVHPLAEQHINQGSMDAAADAYEAEYNAARGIT